MRWTWFPWKWLLRRAARRHGFLDPVRLMARLERFAQPAEVAEPIELLRAGVVFHARGLINTRVIQHNLDWVWPWWIERQFDPADESFLPRAFSITHVNLTHRNWTALGVPNHPALPIVDPRGLVTPLHDGWSLDAWVIAADGERLYPSRSRDGEQTLDPAVPPKIHTRTATQHCTLHQHAWVETRAGQAVLQLEYEAESAVGGQLALAVRPYNPEGVSLIYGIEVSADGQGWQIDGQAGPSFSDSVDRYAASDYRRGDVAMHLCGGDKRARCDAGLANAAALFDLAPGARRVIRSEMPLGSIQNQRAGDGDWETALAGAAELRVPEPRYQFLYDAAVRTLLLHSGEDIYPGPFTYRRFWFRDAALILNALLCGGFVARARRHLDAFPSRQNTATGYFHSQEGEWDSNGQALWIMSRYVELSGAGLPAAWLQAIRKGGRWIRNKRTAGDTGTVHAGLLPPGFSAEHFGPNDYYYWDDLWAVAGLRSMAPKLRQQGDLQTAQGFEQQADDLFGHLERCFAADAERLGRPTLPASPHRRMDSGAVGSLVAGFPLQLVAPDHPGLMGTVEYLYEHARVHGGFFQNMIHSGVNAYLTLHMAQVLMRAGDRRCVELMDVVAGLASPTGQWPEAIHPHTLGGCMGDGQHVWAAAEWLVMLRNAFLREEADRLILAGGLPERWLYQRERLAFGPGPTRFGDVEVVVSPDGAGGGTVSWYADWRQPPAHVSIVGTDGGVSDVPASAGSAPLPARRRA